MYAPEYPEDIPWHDTQKAPPGMLRLCCTCSSLPFIIAIRNLQKLKGVVWTVANLYLYSIHKWHYYSILVYYR